MYKSHTYIIMYKDQLGLAPGLVSLSTLQSVCVHANWCLPNNKLNINLMYKFLKN